MNPKLMSFFALLTMLTFSVRDGAADNKTGLLVETGWISDERCASKRHDDAACPQKCEDSKRKLVFVRDSDKAVLSLRNQELVKGRDGQYVRLTGRLTKKGIVVDSIEKLQPPLPEGAEHKKIGPSTLGPISEAPPDRSNPSFEATVAISGPNQPTTSAFWYYSPPMIRLDIAPGWSYGILGSSGMPGVSIITDVSTKEGYVLIPAEKQYLMFDGSSVANTITTGTSNRDLSQIFFVLSNANATGNPCSSLEDVSCKLVQTDTVDGRVCDEWEITAEATQKVTACVDRELHFPIKIEVADGGTVVFTGIAAEQPDSSVFTVPAGYTKIEDKTTTKPPN